MLHFVIDHRRAFRDHLSKETTQLGNVPLTVAQVVQVLSDRVVTLDRERSEEGAVGALDGQARIQHEHGIGNSVDNALGLHVTCPQNPVEVFQIHCRNTH